MLNISFFFILIKANVSSFVENEESFFETQFEATEKEISGQSNKLESSMFSYDFQDKSRSTIAIKEITTFISTLHSTVTNMHLTQRDTDRIYALFDELTQKSKELYLTLLEDNSSISSSHILDQSADIIRNGLKQQSSVHLRNKNFSENDLFVKPQEIAIGLRWERKRVKRRGRRVWVPRLIQSTFQFVSIIGTLRTLFKSKEFCEMYFQYNSNNRHECTEGTYSDYCCGSTFKTEFFKRNTDSLKIQLYCDEFELCNPLQSKAGVHKVLGVYFSIRNLPAEFRSRLNNIYLVCLVI